ncbi:MAG: CDP-alcohol phosphatidyltransferase family protein [Bacteroidia bacterium]|nr:CDP-alcohol phosphatidyltransferase family protein [Bacteroidia bacterium]MCC6769368.1 CDP-alcohol phosphatidyltransferase family protein [Bacteroidia bacterium]
MLKRNLPNLITLGNLALGCYGILLVLSGRPELAPWCIVLAGLLDFLDGATARLLNAYSAIGKDLDSLADVVSFGVLPGFIARELLLNAISEQTYWGPDDMLPRILEALTLLIPLLSAWRLARFNNDPGQTENFIGLPTPAHAFFWAGLSVGIYQGSLELLNQVWLLALLIVLMPLLLVAPLPMFSLKLKHLKWQGNQVRYIFLLICLPLLFFLQLAGLCPVILLYLLLSGLVLVFSKQTSG